MGKFRNLIRKCPLKIHIYWSWNYKSKKKRLKEQLEEIQRLRALIRKIERGEETVRSYTALSEKAELEAKSDE